MRIRLHKILPTLILFGVFNILCASHVTWFFDFEEAHKEALKQNKHLMVLLIKKDCSISNEIIKTTFMNQPYIDSVNEKFISIIVTKDQKQSYPIEMLYTSTYPALFFLDKLELFSCEPIKGEITPEIFKKHLENCK